MPSKLWGSKVLTPQSGTRAPLSEGTRVSLQGQPGELEAGDRVCLRNGRGLWKDHACSTSALKAKAAADGKRGKAGCTSPSPSFSTSLNPPLLSFDSRGLLINLPALKGQTDSTESQLTHAPLV